MPAIGLGLWKIAREGTAEMVRSAIAGGYRHLDSAADYGNEAEVGEGLQSVLSEGLVTRDELWVTSKLWNTYHHPSHVKLALEKTLDDLQIDYLDLYLIHFPIALKFVPFEERYPPEWFNNPDTLDPGMVPARVPLSDTWHAMEALKSDEVVNHIGICNYSSALLHDLMNYCKTKPEILQIESRRISTTSILSLIHI